MLSAWCLHKLNGAFLFLLFCIVFWSFFIKCSPFDIVSINQSINLVYIVVCVQRSMSWWPNNSAMHMYGPNLREIFQVLH